MTASPSVAAHRLHAALTVLGDELAPPTLDPARRERIAALVDLARREAAELTRMSRPRDRAVGSTAPARAVPEPGVVGGNVVAFRPR